jgi:hypothetical protein
VLLLPWSTVWRYWRRAEHHQRLICYGASRLSKAWAALRRQDLCVMASVLLAWLSSTKQAVCRCSPAVGKPHSLIIPSTTHGTELPWLLKQRDFILDVNIGNLCHIHRPDYQIWWAHHSLPFPWLGTSLIQNMNWLYLLHYSFHKRFRSGMVLWRKDGSRAYITF